MINFSKGIRAYETLGQWLCKDSPSNIPHKTRDHRSRDVPFIHIAHIWAMASILPGIIIYNALNNLKYLSLTSSG